MRVRALAVRILNQLRHDKRTIALMLFAPILLLTLLYFILGESEPTVNVAVINAPAGFMDKLDDSNVIASRYSENQARDALARGEVVATVNIISGKPYIEVDGSNPTKAKQALTALQEAKNKVEGVRPDLSSEVTYVYGYEDATLFDSFGTVLIGFIVFFFTFLVSGISFLQERTSGTLEKLLSMPIKRWEIVGGYVLGFGLFTVLQSFLISTYVIYVLNVTMVGSFGLVLLITLLTAMVALTLGILVSTAASSEFQMMQFIPVIIIPQIFFSGLFDLPAAIEFLEPVMPLYYVADALTQVMIKGNGISMFTRDIGVLLGCSSAFMLLNTLLLKKYRRI
ncbi:MAG: Inner membrane transport permease YbhS [Pelotomaculum sp. PtaB.Bin104]|nr:MAG: Inner membrane transport permease YbhS [Pelotomaculum sp. PtaB.Bin104]